MKPKNCINDMLSSLAIPICLLVAMCTGSPFRGNDSPTPLPVLKVNNKLYNRDRNRKLPRFPNVVIITSTPIVHFNAVSNILSNLGFNVFVVNMVYETTIHSSSIGAIIPPKIILQLLKLVKFSNTILVACGPTAALSAINFCKYIDSTVAGLLVSGDLFSCNHDYSHDYMSLLEDVGAVAPIMRANLDDASNSNDLAVALEELPIEAKIFEFAEFENSAQEFAWRVSRFARELNLVDEDSEVEGDGDQDDVLDRAAYTSYRVNFGSLVAGRVIATSIIWSALAVATFTHLKKINSGVWSVGTLPRTFVVGFIGIYRGVFAGRNVVSSKAKAKAKDKSKSTTKPGKDDEEEDWYYGRDGSIYVRC